MKILLAERFALTLNNAENKDILGSFISGIESESSTALFDYSSGTSYTKTSQFKFYQKILDFTNKYPIYSQHIAGTIDSTDYWIEEFKNTQGKKAWLAFCPLRFSTIATSNSKGTTATATNKEINCPQTAIINSKEVTITEEPIFVE